jgi:hypothetical protein
MDIIIIIKEYGDLNNNKKREKRGKSKKKLINFGKSIKWITGCTYKCILVSFKAPIFFPIKSENITKSSFYKTIKI